MPNEYHRSAMTTALLKYPDDRVRLYLGDITEHPVDAIVNAANRTLLGGGGVDGAIHRRGGPAILEACRALRSRQWPDGLPTGQVAITTGGDLLATYVIHTVGPIYGQHNGQEPALLADCYRHSLELAASLALKSIAFPAISTGIYGYPPAQASVVVSSTLSSTLARIGCIEEVRLVFLDAAQFEIFVAHQRFPY